MHFATTIELRHLRSGITRPGFDARFHEVVFAVRQENLAPIEISLFVHEAYPEDDVVAVARGLLAGRLTDMAAAAQEGALRPGEINALWKKVAPAS
jgi:hypothetical protein